MPADEARSHAPSGNHTCGYGPDGMCDEYPHYVRLGCSVDGCTYDSFRYLHRPPGR